MAAISIVDSSAPSRKRCPRFRWRCSDHAQLASYVLDERSVVSIRREQDRAMAEVYLQ
jgi:hypothetical protein